jgi:hypothetical protein
MKLWPFFFFAMPLFATVNEPWRWELFTGYRNDRIHWHLQESGDGGPLTYSELYRDVEFWENGLTLKTIYRDLSFLFRGAYGTFGRSSLFQRYANLNFTLEQPQFRFSTEGWTADGMGYFGYAVNLTADRTYKVIFTPLIGYSTHFERLHRGEGTPALLESTDSTLANFYAMSSKLPRELHLTWHGFLFGAQFAVQPGGRLNFDVGYTYHRLYTRLTTAVQNQVQLGDPLISDAVTFFSMSAKGGSNLGHTGWGQVDYLLSRFWRIGLGGQIHYFVSRVLTTTLHQEETFFPLSDPVFTDLPQKFKLRWTSFSGWFQISREF